MHVLTFVSSSVGGTLKPAGLDKSVGIVSVGIRAMTAARRNSGPGWTNTIPRATAATVQTSTATLSRTLMQVLQQCGNNLSRENVMHEAANLHDLEMPLLLPSIRINTSPTGYRSVKQMQPIRFNGRNWDLFGDVLAG